MTETGASDASRKTPRRQHPKSRAKVTNAMARGSLAWLDGKDRRGVVSRRIADIVGLITQDLGGLDALTETQRQIITRIATMAVWCETQDCKAA